MTEMDAEAGARGADRKAGIVLVAAAAASVFAMAHHPTSIHAAVMGGIVHGVLILFTAAIAFGFTHFSIQRGLGRPPRRATEGSRPGTAPAPRPFCRA